MVLAGSLTSSWIGLGMRSIEAASAWQVLVYRSFAVVIFLLAVIAWRHGGQVTDSFRKAGWPALIGGLGLAAAFCGILVAIEKATVANAMFLLAAAPFIAALLGRLVLGERVRPATWLAIACAFAGVAIMVSQGIALGHFWGNLAGLIAGLGLAVFVIALRRGHLTDMLPLNVIGGGIGVAIATAVCLASGQSLVLSAHDTLLALAMGAFQLGLALVLITLGSRSVPSAQLALLTMFEVVMAPLWVWLVLGETAGVYTLLGGALVLAAIAYDALGELRRSRAR